MKKRFLLVLAVFSGLISLYAVQAQEETTEKILGIELSSLLIALPIIMALISLIFFLEPYLKDHYKGIIYNFKNRFRKGSLKEVKIEIVDYPKEVRALQKHIRVLEPEEAMMHLSNLAKRFFTENFNINYEFSHGELEKKLEKEKAAWASFPKKLSQLKYSGEPLSKKEVGELAKEFWSIVNYDKRKDTNITMIKEPKKRRSIFEIRILKNIGHYLGGVFKKLRTDTANEMKTQLEAIKKVKTFFSNKLIRRKTKPTIPLEKERKKLTYKEDTSSVRLKKFGGFFTKKEEAIEKTFKQTQKQVFDHVHNIAKQAKKPPEPIKKEYEKAKLVKIEHEQRPHKPPAPPPIHVEKKEIREPTNVDMDVKKEQELQIEEEEERLFGPPVEIPKVRMDIKPFKELHEEVKKEKVMKKVQKPPRIPLKPAQKVPEKQPQKYEWEVTAEDIRRKKTRVMNDLLKEEEDIQSKLRDLE